MMAPEGIGLHEVDKPKPPEAWSLQDLDNMLIFCLLDRVTAYSVVCRAYDALEHQGFTTRGQLRAHITMFGTATMSKRIAIILREVGYRFPQPAADFIVLFATSDVDLAIISRDMLVQAVKGIGMKLASMFLRNTRGKEYLVIDTHVKKWLAEHGCPYTTYEEQEQWFKDYCEENGLDVYEQDITIWNKMRR